jgi:hypothetical protein
MVSVRRVLVFMIVEEKMLLALFPAVADYA